jgi:hypothetical protein
MKHIYMNINRRTVVKMEAGFVDVQIQQPPIVWEQPVVQEPVFNQEVMVQQYAP